MIEGAEDAASSAFAISQEDMDYVLQHGSGLENGKHRICDYCKGNHSVNETAAFLKKEYAVPEGGHDEIDALAAKARKLGIEYLKLCDKDIDAFIRSVIDRMKEKR